MREQLHRTLSLAPVALLASGAVALAAPIKGATYKGTTAHGSAPITLKVSKSGKSVKLDAPFPPLYCEGGGVGARQITKAASVSKSGSFKASITYEFQPTHRITGRLLVKGKLSGHKVKGTASSEFPLAPQCGGSTSFTAKSK